MEALLEGMVYSILAGLATGLGGIVAVGFKHIKRAHLNFIIGIVSGMMLTIAFLSLLAESLAIGDFEYSILGFIIGSLTLLIIDFTIPHIHVTIHGEHFKIDKKVLRRSIIVALGIAMHNAPEGMAVALTYSYKQSLGLLTALAIGVHNIPEGIITAIPLLNLNVKKDKILLVTLFSGLTEPAFALLTFLIFSIFNPLILAIGASFAAAAMIYITVDELIPEAYSTGHEHMIIIGLILGVIISLYLLRMFGD